MPSEVFKSIGAGQQTAPQQDPRQSALDLMKQQGITIPEGMENNPQALLQHVMSSGKVPQNRLGMAQQLMSRMFGGRR